MKKRVTGWLALMLAMAVLLTACGAPSAAASSRPAPQQSAGASSSSAPVSVPEEDGKTPESEASAPASQPEEEKKAPESEAPAPASQPEEDEKTPESEASAPAAQPEEGPESTLKVTEDGWYNTKDEVALYLHQYNRLPDNYVTKNQAQKKGWSGGSVEKYTGEGTAIGGNRFGNYEGLLPEKKGRTYTECDINTVGKSKRGAERIIFSNDGLVYYTADHYQSFELLYGEP